MSDYVLTKPPKWHPNAVMTPAGWADPNTGEVIKAIVDLNTKANNLGTTGSIISVLLNPVVSTTYKFVTQTSYVTDNVMTIAVQFSDVVTVSGTPQITVTIGGSGHTVNYTSSNTLYANLKNAGLAYPVTGTNVLNFNYTIVGGDVADGVSSHVVITNLALNGGTITDATNLGSATLTLPSNTNTLIAGVKVNS